MNKKKNYQEDLFSGYAPSDNGENGLLGRVRETWERGRRLTFVIERTHLAMGVLCLTGLFVLTYCAGIDRGKKLSRPQHETLNTADVPAGRADDPAWPSAPEEPGVLGANVPARAQTTPNFAKRSGTDAVRPGQSCYVVQLVTFRDQSEAKKEVEKLKRKGYNPFIDRSKQFFQVCEGYYATAAAARSAADALKGMYHDCFVKNYTRKR